MPPIILINRFAKEILEPEYLHVAKDILDKHIETELNAPKKDRAKLTKLLSLAEILDKEIERATSPA